MPVNFYLDTDHTGSLNSNLITDERHTVPDVPIRIIAPDFGAFYVDSLIVNSINTTTNNATPLIKGVDYTCLEVDIDDTSKSGKEVCHVILITKTTFDLTFDITYQAVGGANSPSVPLLLQAFNALNINHKIRNWSDVAHKPDAYPPNPHLHDSQDIYGLEYIIKALDNIKSVIGNSAYNTVHDYLIKKIKVKLQNLTPTLSSVINNKLDTLSILTDRAEKTLVHTYSQYLATLKKLDEIKFGVDKITAINQEYKNNNYNGIYSNLLSELAKRQSRENLMILNTPDRIEDLELWLDADDSSKVNITSNQTVWIDKSLNQRHYVNGQNSTINLIDSVGIRGKCFEFSNGKHFNRASGRDFNLCLNMTFICITNALSSTINNAVLFSNGSGFVIYGNVDTSKTFRFIGNNLEVDIESNNNDFPRLNILSISTDVENSYACSYNLSTKQKLSASINSTVNLDTINATLNTIGSPSATQSSAISQILVYNRRLAKCEIDCIVEYFYHRNKP